MRCEFMFKEPSLRFLEMSCELMVQLVIEHMSVPMSLHGDRVGVL